jgi:hypothetical protein
VRAFRAPGTQILHRANHLLFQLPMRFGVRCGRKASKGKCVALSQWVHRHLHVCADAYVLHAQVPSSSHRDTIYTKLGADPSPHIVTIIKKRQTLSLFQPSQGALIASLLQYHHGPLLSCRSSTSLEPEGALSFHLLLTCSAHPSKLSRGDQFNGVVFASMDGPIKW